MNFKKALIKLFILLTITSLTLCSAKKQYDNRHSSKDKNSLIINDIENVSYPDIIYFPDMKHPINASKFQVVVITVLNNLYQKNAMSVYVSVPNNLNEVNVNVLEKIISSKDITTIERGETNSFIPIKNKIKFNPDFGILFRISENSKIYPSDLNATEIPIDLGRNSPMSLLAHELYHSYNYQFDKEYFNRKNDKSTKDNNPLSFPNKEEEYVTLYLQNQTNDILGENRRINYGKNYYETISAISTFPRYPTIPKKYDRLYN